MPLHTRQNGPIRVSASRKCQGGCGGEGALLHRWQDCELVQPPWRAGQGFLKKLKIKLPYGLAIPCPGTYPDKTPTRKVTGIPMFIAATSTTAKTGTQSKCPSAEGCMKKIRTYISYIHTTYIHTTEYYSAKKKGRNNAICSTLDGPRDYHTR